MIAQILTQIASIVGGGINSAIGLVVSTMQKGFQAAVQFHKEGIAFARDVGLSAKQAQAYTNTLIERTQVLANRYGVSAEAIMQVQRGLSEATGKQLMLNNAQAEGFVQIDRIMGAQARAKFTEEIMNGMGGQINTVQNAMAKVYATAAKQGLNAKNLSDKVAQNLSMANRLTFRNGIDGITRMAAMSEKLGINMASVESAANQFLDLDKAIENAAQMQMLGGSAAVNFGNPLTAAYEANYDPEAFAKRMSDSLASYATFDTKSGMGRITNAADMDMVRNMARVMGISVDDASKMAKKQAEVRYKESQFMPRLESLGLSEDQRNFIINNAQVTNQGRDLELNGMNLAQLAANPQKLKELMDFEGMSDKDILYKQSTQLKSIDDNITGASAKVAASFAEGVNKYLGDFGKQIQEIGNFLSGHAKNWGKSVGEALMNFSSWVNKNGSTILEKFQGVLNGVDKIVGLIGPLSEWITKNPWKALFAYVGLKSLPKITPAGASARAGKLGLGASNSLKIGGAALGIGIGAYKVINSYTRYNEKTKELGEQLRVGAISKTEYDDKMNDAKNEKNIGIGGGVGTAIGATIGTFIGGPIGAAVGGWLGGEGGKLIVKYWDDIKKFGQDSWNAIKEFASIAWDGMKDLAKGAWNLVLDGARSAISKGISTIMPVMKVMGQAFWTYMKGVGLGVWDVIKGSALGIWEAIKGSALGIWEIIKGVWEGFWDLVSAPFMAISDVVSGFKNGISQIADGHIIDGILNIGKGVFKGAFDLISAPFKALYDVGAGVFKGIGEFIKGIWNGIGEFIKGIWNGIKSAALGVWRGLLIILSHIPYIGKYIDVPQEEHKNGGFIASGAVGIEKPINYFGDTAQYGEVVLNPTQQRNFMALANDASSVRAKEYGAEREYIYKPNGSETSNVNGNTITVKDFNINLSGTLRLDGGNASRNIDMNALLNDYQFINTLKEMIKTSINNDMNGGRFMNDLATRRGHVSSSSIIGR